MGNDQHIVANADDDDDALLIALAALAKASDESGGIARRAALLTRLSMSLADLSERDRRRLSAMAVLFEGVTK